MASTEVETVWRGLGKTSAATCAAHKRVGEAALGGPWDWVRRAKAVCGVPACERDRAWRRVWAWAVSGD